MTHGYRVCFNSYQAAAEDAADRLRRGESQVYCRLCVTAKRGGWVWPHECNHPGRQTEQEHEAALSQAAKVGP